MRQRVDQRRLYKLIGFTFSSLDAFHITHSAPKGSTFSTRIVFIAFQHHRLSNYHKRIASPSSSHFKSDPNRAHTTPLLLIERNVHSNDARRDLDVLQINSDAVRFATLSVDTPKHLIVAIAFVQRAMSALMAEHRSHRVNRQNVSNAVVQ